MLTMVDMGMGNLQSVVEAFRRVGAEVRTTDRPEQIDRAEAIILPGVGAFGDAMKRLRTGGLVEPLRRHAVERGRPLFGICLGMQLLADVSEEHGTHDGLGLIGGRVVPLKATQPGFRVPNMGWCDVTPAGNGAGFTTGASFYFAHSYHLVCSEGGDVAGTIDYSGRPLTVAIERGNIFAAQFHPEKSQEAGLDLLERMTRRLKSS